MDNKRTTILAFVAIAMMFAVAFIGFVVIDEADADDVEGNFIVDGKGYGSFADAIDAAKASTGKELKFNVNDSTSFLTADFKVSYEVSGLTIDLNDHTITTVNGGFVLEGVGFTVCNGTIDAQGGSYALRIGNGENTTSDVTVTGVTLVGGINIFCANDVKLQGINYTGTNYYTVWCDTNANVIIENGVYSTTSDKSVLGGANVSKYNNSMKIEGGTFEVIDDQYLVLATKGGNDDMAPVITGGFFYQTGKVSTKTITLENELKKYVLEGYYVTSATVGEVEGYKVVPYEASITADGKTTYYKTLIDAIVAVENGQTIKMHCDVDAGSGIGIFAPKGTKTVYNVNKIDMKITAGQSFTIDFDNHSYYAYKPPVGSEKTENQVFHLEKGISITLKNGTLGATEGANNTRMVIQNYCDLTLDSMTLDGTYLGYPNTSYYTMSNNNGTVIIKDSTIIAKDGWFAFDVYSFSTYTGANVTVQNSIVNGKIEVDYDTGANIDNLRLTINSGTINGTISVSDSLKGKVTIDGGTFSDLSGLQYLADTGTYGLSKGAVISGELTLKSGQKLSVLKDVTLKIPENVVFTGTVIGPEDNTFVANGVKAGEGGITITGGSLIINGKVKADVKSGDTITVSGESIKIAGELDADVSLVIKKDAIVTIEEGTTFTSNGTITNAGTITNEGKLTNSSTSKITNTGSIENKSSIVNEGTVESTGTVTNTGTLKMTGSSEVTGSVVNNGVVADERTSGEAVEIDNDNSTGVVVTKTNADAYKGTDTKVIVEDPETSGITEGTVTVESDTYAFVDGITTTGDYVIVMKNQQYGTYTLTIPEGTVIADATIITIKCDTSRTTSNSMSYEITTPEIKEFSVKVPVQTGFKSAKVVCIDHPSTEITKIRYNSSSGYVSFNAEHNSTFTITLSEATPSSGTSDAIDENTAFVGAIVVLVVAILALAVVIKRR